MRSLFRASLTLAVLITAGCANLPSLGEHIPGPKRHSGKNGSVLKAAEDKNGKRWRVEEFPLGAEVFGISADGLCAVPVQAREYAIKKSIGGILAEYYFLHPDTGERIEASVFGSCKGFIDLHYEYQWY